jgi:hypothetical protein
MALIDVWEVTPHLSDHYDSWIGEVKDDPEGKKAMEYAKQVIEERWDTGDLKELDITVRLRRTMIDEESIRED